MWSYISTVGSLKYRKSDTFWLICILFLLAQPPLLGIGIFFSPPGSVPTLCDALECLLYDTKIVLCTYCSDLAAGWLIFSKPNLAVVNLYCWFFFLLQPYPISENWVSFGFVLLMPTSHQVQESHRVSSTCICMHQSCSVLILRFLTVQIKEDWLLYLLFVVQGTSPWRCTSPG